MSTKVQQTIHRKMTIEDILALFPHKAQRLAQEITNAGLQCVGCGAASFETLEEGMRGHGKAEEEIDALVDALNALLEEESDPDSITFTPRGAKKFLSILEHEKKQGYALRFGDRKAGCSGFEYILDYSKEASENDEVFVSEGIEIHIEKSMLPRLKGCQIDYVDGLMGSGFKITNPNVAKSCGCGSSHGY